DGQRVATAGADHLATFWTLTRSSMLVPVGFGFAPEPALLSDGRIVWHSAAALHVAPASAVHDALRLGTRPQPTSVHVVDAGRMLIAVEDTLVERWALPDASPLSPLPKPEDARVLVTDGATAIAFEHGGATELVDVRDGTVAARVPARCVDYSRDLERVIVD